MPFIRSFIDHCNRLQQKHLHRRLLPKCCTGNPMIDFSSNDYLALSQHPEVINAACEAAKTYGTGATGSRLLSGNHEAFMAFEEQIALAKNAPAALIFNSGYQANISVLAALCESTLHKTPPLIFFDKLNHASLYQGAFLSKARLIRYHHNDMHDLTNKLEHFKANTSPKFIVSETVFGMDGDVVDLKTLVSLAKHHQALLYLDEAHATGLFGPQGYGLSTTLDMSSISYLIMGTFSKALGCAGAYVACSTELKDYLINRCQGFIYSTALPPMVIAAAARAWQLLPGMAQQRQDLQATANTLRTQLHQLKNDTGLSSTHIIPLIKSDSALTQRHQEQLEQQGILVSAIRPPTAPSPRLRLALTVEHGEAEIGQLLSALKLL